MATEKKPEKTEKTRVEFDYDGQHYVLEYTAASLKKMEDRGFDASLMESRTIQYPEEIFCGAFIANHDNVSYDKRMELFHELTDAAENSDVAEDGTKKDNIINVFTRMVGEAVAEIRSHKGNVKWKVKK